MALRTVGLIGGMSWESTALYYRLANEGVRQRCGGLHSAPLVIASVDFAPVAARQHDGDWAWLAQHMADSARTLEYAGATAIALATNTMHKVADAIEAAVAVPLLHIADATGAALAAAGVTRVGLLGTAFTMEQDFYRDRLTRFGCETIVPDAEARAAVHRIIYDELVQGVVRPESRALYRAVMAALVAQGAQGIVLGCTEITMLVDSSDAAVPLYDTTALHAAAVVDWIVGNG